MIEALLNLPEGQHIAVAGSQISVNDWARLMDYPSPMKLELHPNWWYGADCTDCHSLLFKCKHYPVQHKTALEWQTYYEAEAKRKPSVDNSVENVNNFASEKSETASYPSVVRHNRTTLLELTPEDKVKALALYDAGECGLVALAKTFNVQIPYMRELLLSENRELTPRGGARKTRTEMSPDEQKAAALAYNSGARMVDLMEKYNVQQVYMKEILLANGCEVKKGRRSKPEAGEQAIAA